MTPANKSEYVAAMTTTAIFHSENCLRKSGQDVLECRARIAETRGLIALSRRLLAKPLPVGAIPFLSD